MPTIFDYLGRPALCDDCRGQSLVPLISGTDEFNEPHVTIPTVRINRINYFKPWKESRGDVNVMLRQDNWKGIWNDELKSLELYDLETDPMEQVDVGRNHAELAVSLGESASQWLETCRSLAPPPEEMQEIDETTMEKLRAMGYFN